MKWILVGYILNTLISQGFDTREACEGRAVLLREQKAVAKCVELPMPMSFSNLCVNCISGVLHVQ